MEFLLGLLIEPIFWAAIYLPGWALLRTLGRPIPLEPDQTPEHYLAWVCGVLCWVALFGGLWGFVWLCS